MTTNQEGIAMSAEESRAEFDHAVAVLGVEVEYILNGRLDHGDCYVCDDEPCPGFEGVWVYVADGQARLLCRWVVEGVGDVTLDSLDLAEEPRRRVEAWVAGEAGAAGYRIGAAVAGDDLDAEIRGALHTALRGRD